MSAVFVFGFVSGSLATAGGDAVTRAEASSCAVRPVTSTAVVPFYGMPGTEARAGDPVGPFPLSALVPFPWSTIEGVWTMKLPDGNSLNFSFDVEADCDGRKFIHVQGFDQKTYRVSANGVGIAVANDMMVRAVMTSSSSQYMIYIRQFKVPVTKAVSKSVSKLTTSTVVTIRPFDGDPLTDVHMVARKASNLTLPNYVQEQRAADEKRQANIRLR